MFIYLILKIIYLTFGVLFFSSQHISVQVGHHEAMLEKIHKQ
jgi:hypothetical protein